MSNYYFERLSQQLNYPIHAFFTTSPRKILFIANFILAICAICITGVAAYLCFLLYDPLFTTGYINWLGLSVVGVGLVVTAIIGMRGAHLVSLELLLTYFWGIIIFIVPLMLGLFACFNFFLYTRIWFKHAWTLPNFIEVRSLFCEPRDTADSKCKAPIFDELSTSAEFNVTSWCIQNYNAVDCEEIRNAAISRAVSWGVTIIIAQTVVGGFALFIIAFSIYTSHQILTSPVITQSMLDIINYLLTFPIGGCFGLGAYFWWIRTVDIAYAWLPSLYLGLGLAQVFALPLGIAAGRYKSRLLLSTYIALITLIMAGLALAAAIGWALAKFVLVNYQPSSEEVGDIACEKGLSGCTKCDTVPVSGSSSTARCPEWSKYEVVTLVSLDLRLAGMVSTVSILYMFGALIVAFLVRNNLKNYKSDFI